MRPSEAIALGALLAAACSPRILVVVDPDPCADGAVTGCVPPGLLDDLVGHWRLDDGTGSVTARDSSGRGNNGTLLDLDPATAWVSGRAAGGLNVAAAGWVGVTPSASIDAITDRLTIAAWIYFDGTISDWGTAASRQIANGFDQHYHITLAPEGRPSLFVVTAAGGVLLMAPNLVPRATWVHLAGSYDGATARLYVDGALAASSPLVGSIVPDTTPLIIGANGNGPLGVPSELFPGRLDEVMLYRRALGDIEIGQLHAGVLFPTGAVTDAGATD